MGEDTKIEWADFTFNPWSGCTKVSPGCANCYAEKLGGRFPQLGNWGPGAERKRTTPANWRKPLAWARSAACAHDDAVELHEATSRPRVFCASLADWLDPEVPAEWLADLLALIAATPELDWLLLTKRPKLWRERMESVAEPYVSGESDHTGAELSYQWACGAAPRNVWLGTSVEDQQRADERHPHLMAIPARVHFWSAEPLLGSVRLPGDPPDWVIAGGESGPGARPMHPSWARSLRDQCQEAGVAFHFKQWGAWAQGLIVEEDDKREAAVVSMDPPLSMIRVGKKAAGRLLDGRTWDEVPHG